MAWVSGVSSITSYGWAPLSMMSGASLDIGVDFIVRADDEHGALAFDDVRGITAQNGPLGSPP